MTTAWWDAERVLDAANARNWIPDDAPEVRTDEYVVVSPDYLGGYASIRVFGSERDPADVAAEVAEITRTWGRDRMRWQVTDVTRPAGAYRAVRMERLRIGAAARATLALSRRAVHTSARILRRVGFVGYRQERVLVLDRP